MGRVAASPYSLTQNASGWPWAPSTLRFLLPCTPLLLAASRTPVSTCLPAIAQLGAPCQPSPHPCSGVRPGRVLCGVHSAPLH